jgi:predicted permease
MAEGCVHVVGAGLAGLSAAIRLTEQGCKVVVHEANHFAGGRCRTFHDPRLDRSIDNGNHLILSGNRAARRYLATIGATGMMEELPARFRPPVQDLPITDGNSMWSILVDGAPQTSVANAPAAMPQKVTHGYFEAMRIPVVRGRIFTAADRVDAPLVAVINETMARKLWPGKDAIGGTVKLLNETLPWVTVVGVVKDVRSSGFLTDPPPTMYFPQAQAGKSAWYVPSTLWLIVRTNADPRAVVGQIRSIVREIAPAAPIARVQTMSDAVAASVAPRRFTTLLLLAFAMVAMILAGLGIYSVIAYAVSQRRAEMGIRMALGARRGQVVSQVLGEGVRTAAVGAAVGIVLALATTRFLRAMAVGVSPGDPGTLAVVAVTLMLVAVAAAYVPARRASGVDPARAIRAD